MATALRKTATYKRMETFITSSDSINKMEYLFDRWQDEKEYEDWADYENAIRDHWGDPDTFVKATKRPFGFIVRDPDQNCAYHYKLRVTSSKVFARADITMARITK
jgi:hypothetical protein